MSGITHLVLFQFKDGISAEKKLELSKNMLSLQEKCLSASTNERYIKSTKGGLDNSPEGLQDGLTHAFVVEFESAEDRDYYVFKDQAHLDFVKMAGEVLTKATVVDFTPGSFGPTAA